MPTINKLSCSLTPKPTEPQQLRQIRLLLPALLLLFSCLCALASAYAQVAPSPPALDQVANLIRAPLVRQSTNFTCGVAALQSVLAYYGQDSRDDKLRKALRSRSRYGTHYQDILKLAVKLGFQAQAYENLTLAQLQGLIDHKTPPILVIQAWVEGTPDWPNDWEDGHYVVAVGYDEDNIYFMDPATIGNYTYIPIPEFLDRWHDQDRPRKKLYNFGIVIDGKPPAYDPEEIKRMN